ncbi:MAG: hypothetical protein AB1589_45025 [Cyanobacteriota bacterium]
MAKQTKSLETNIGKTCTILYCQTEYTIEAYSPDHGSQYLLRANGYPPDGGLMYGWVDVKKVKLLRERLLAAKAD